MGNVTQINAARPKVLEFFAGIGLARMGLEKAGFRVAWANDFEPSKKFMYDMQFGWASDHDYALGDVAAVQSESLPRDAAVAWASSPCTDLSLAGGRAGLQGSQSGTFWHFIRILRELGEDRPRLVVLENVTGLASSHGGDDIAAAIRAFNELGYSVDVLALDARRFVPQSRPRLFLIGAIEVPVQEQAAESPLRPEWLQWIFEDPTLVTHRYALPTPPEPQVDGMSAMMEDLPANDPRWWDANRTDAFLNSLSQIQRERLQKLQDRGEQTFRTAYRRTRHGVAVWEVRADDIAGCLRTARGGSSKQAVVRLGDEVVAVRWMTPVEYARLMGAGDYNLSGARSNQVLFGFGDAVAVPAVSWLADNYLMPIVRKRFAEAERYALAHG